MAVTHQEEHSDAVTSAPHDDGSGDSDRRSPVTVRSGAVVRSLVAIALVLIAANLAVNILKLVTDDRSFYGIIPLFELKSENNVPTYFSGLLFIVNSMLLLMVWRVLRPDSRLHHVWGVLSGLFLFLAFDEYFEIHEQLIDPVGSAFGTSGLLHFAWVIPYFVGVLVVAAFFLPAWWRLPSNIRWLLVGSAVVYLLGAIGFEMVGGAYYDGTGSEGGPVYAALYTIEESLEMAGLILLTYSLMRLLTERAGGDLEIVLSA